jgi:hypothetical protein
MRGICRLLSAIVVVGGIWQAGHGLGPAIAQVATKQIALTEKQVERFIAAQSKIAVVKAEEEAEAVAKEFGFAGIDEHDDVEANILLLLESIDPQSRTFLEPPLQIKRRIEAIKADASLPDAERAQTLADLTEALKSAKPIQFPTNIELVQRYYEKIQAVLQ